MPVPANGKRLIVFVLVIFSIFFVLYYPNFQLIRKSVHFDPLNAKPGFGTLYGRNPESKEMSFMLVGDWGMKSHMQDILAHQMEINAEKYKTQFILSNGDNIYSWGAGSVYDPRFYKIFESSYTLNPTFDKMPWYMALGNHDRRGNIAAQLQYATYDTRWVMPQRFYTFYLPIFDHLSLPPVQVIVLDTLPLVCPDIENVPTQIALQNIECESFLYSLMSREMAANNGGTMTIDDYTVIHQIISRERELQLKWLEKALSENETNGWKIVVGHHAFESASTVHGPQAALNQEVRPILNKYNVDVYICGHDHNLQHISKVNDKIDHFVVGGGGFVTTSRSLHALFSSQEYPGIQFAKTTYGFAVASLSPTEMTMRFIDYYGKEIYKTIITKNGEPVVPNLKRWESQLTKPGNRFQS